MTRATPISIGISGALGRMGQVTAGLVRARSDMTLAALIDQPVKAGEASSGLELARAEDALPLCQVIIDFSTARASARASSSPLLASPALTGWSIRAARVMSERARTSPAVTWPIRPRAPEMPIEMGVARVMAAGP